MQQAWEEEEFLPLEDGDLGGPQARTLPPFAALLCTDSFTFSSFLLLLLLMMYRFLCTRSFQGILPAKLRFFLGLERFGGFYG